MEFVRLQDKHFKQVLKISDNTLGKNYLTENQLEEYLDSEVNLAFVMVDQEEVLGFTSLVILTPPQLKHTALKENKWFYDISKKYSNIALRRQTIVNPEFMNKGVGSKLFELSSKAIESLTNFQVSTAWKNEKNIPMKSILLKNGFDHIKTIENYWKVHSLNHNYHCIECWIPPCKCATEVYIKKNAPDKSDAF